MSIVQEAVKKSETPSLEASQSAAGSSPAWGWLPNILMFFLLAVALWNYLSEREYRRQMEARLETAIAELESSRADFQRVERQSREMEDLLHAELEAANGRIAKMKFDLDSLRADRDSTSAALAAANRHIETMESQNRRLHEVIQSNRHRRAVGSSVSASGSMTWDLPAASRAAANASAAPASEN